MFFLFQSTWILQVKSNLNKTTLLVNTEGMVNTSANHMKNVLTSQTPSDSLDCVCQMCRRKCMEVLQPCRCRGEQAALAVPARILSGWVRDTTQQKLCCSSSACAWTSQLVTHPSAFTREERELVPSLCGEIEKMDSLEMDRWREDMGYWSGLWKVQKRISIQRTDSNFWLHLHLFLLEGDWKFDRISEDRRLTHIKVCS